MIGGVSKVVIGVEDQERAKASWVETLGFEVAQDAPYGQERWLEVRTPDKAVVVVLDVRKGPRPTAPDPSLPTSSVFFCAEDLQQTYTELSARGVRFPLAPVEQPFGWWSLFEDPDGNRFALVPRAVGLQRSDIGVRTAPGRRGRPAGHRGHHPDPPPVAPMNPSRPATISPPRTPASAREAGSGWRCARVTCGVPPGAVEQQFTQIARPEGAGTAAASPGDGHPS
jgi:lactoylglutathione lyase